MLGITSLVNYTKIQIGSYITLVTLPYILSVSFISQNNKMYHNKQRKNYHTSLFLILQMNRW